MKTIHPMKRLSPLLYFIVALELCRLATAADQPGGNRHPAVNQGKPGKGVGGTAQRLTEQ
jgi:hypothetical protein